MKPLAPRRRGVPDGIADERGCDALPLMLASDLGIEEEGVIASVPGHVDEADQAASCQAGGHPAQAAGPDLVPPPSDGMTAVCGDKGHHLRVAHWPPPAVLNRLGHTRACRRRRLARRHLLL